MKNNYTLISVMSALVLATLIYGFTVVGLPVDARGKAFDETRVSNLNELKYQLESYARTHYALPKTLEEFQTENSYTKVKDPETDKYYEYTVTGQYSYKLCATFATSSDELKGSSRSYLYDTSGLFKHEKGYQCFPFTVSNVNAYNNIPYTKPVYTYPTPTPYIVISPTPLPRSIDDENIDSISTNVAYDSYLSVFPAGFFSERDEYGLINYHNEPVTVVVKFYTPVKLTSITNIFSFCASTAKDCYKWTAVGLTDTNKSVTLGTDIIVSNQTDTSVLPIRTDDSYKQMSFTVTRIGGPDSYVHWRKIKFAYK